MTASLLFVAEFRVFSLPFRERFLKRSWHGVELYRRLNFFLREAFALLCRSKLLTTTTFWKAAQICTDGVGQKFCWTSFKNAEAECLQSASTHLKKERKKEINVLFGEAAKAY